MPPMIDAAIALARQGRAVFPVRPDKRPLVQWGTEATRDEATISGWWSRWPDAGIGMATGVRSGVWALDVDPRHGGDESIDALQREHGDLPDTATVWTGGGGAHYWFLWPAEGGPRNSAGVVGPGLDVRGDGGYVVVPPSMHECGRRYEWRIDAEPAEAPAWLLAATVPRAVPAPKPRADADIPEGRRDRTLFELAASMRANGFDADAILAAVEATNTARCRPPLDDADVRRIVGSASRYERGQPAPVRVAVAPTDERGANRAPLERFSEVVLAREMLRELAEGSGGIAPVCDEGTVHAYDPASGLWEPVDAAALSVAAASHDGRLVYAGADAQGEVKYKPLGLGRRQIRGAAEIAADECRDDGFFGGAALGVPVLGGYAVVSSMGWTVAGVGAERRARNGLPWRADPASKCPGWLAFLDAVLAGESVGDTAARIGLLQEWLGGCLVGAATLHQRCLVLTGAGGNGKTQILEVAQALFPGCVSHVVPQDMAQEYSLAMLVGSRLNVCSEVPDAEICGTEKFKALIDGSPVRARRIYGAPFTLRPIAGHLFACNALPGTQDHSEGYWRRFIVLALHASFHGSARHEAGIGARIVATEMPGVLRWALDGAVRLAARGAYQVPASSSATVAEWRETADPVASFVRDECEADIDGSAAGTLYAAYVAWARDNGHKPVSSTRFGPRLVGLGHQRQRDRVSTRYPLRLRGRTLPAPSMKWD